MPAAHALGRLTFHGSSYAFSDNEGRSFTRILAGARGRRFSGRAFVTLCDGLH
jgi:hypothetical protein